MLYVRLGVRRGGGAFQWVKSAISRKQPEQSSLSANITETPNYCRAVEVNTNDSQAMTARDGPALGVEERRDDPPGPRASSLRGQRRTRRSWP